MDHLKCQNCALATLCVPHAIPQEELERIESVVNRSRPMQPGDHLFQIGEAFRSVYAVSSGALKTYVVAPDGEQRVTGFVLPGELAGLGGISTNKHQNSALALDTTMVCELPFDRMEKLSAELPGLQHYFFESLSRELIDSQRISFLLGNRNVEERVSAFLWSLSVRHARRKLSATRFRLPMARADIASYLGMTPETLSRVIRSLSGRGLAQIKGREVELTDLGSLAELAGTQMNADAAQIASSPA